MVLTGKIFTLVFWALVVAGLAGSLGEYSEAMAYAGALILVAHAIEATLMHTAWKERANPTPLDTVLVLVFGFFHLKPLVDEGKTDEEI